MSEVIGRGVIELSGDSSKLNAAISTARKSIDSLGTASETSNKRASASIDRYVRSLQTVQKTAGMSARETELYKLALRGASDEQLRAANSALKLTEAYQTGQKIGKSLMAAGALVATSFAGAVVVFDQLVKKAGEFQGLAEKTGDSAQNIASLSVAASVKGLDIGAVADNLNKLTQRLTGVDDGSVAAGAAIKALGLDLGKFKQLTPTDQVEAIGKAMNGFEEGAGKSSVAMALFGESGAQMLPLLKEIGSEGGRQVILTETQIKQADEYGDKQAKLRAEISLHAQAIAAQMLPAYNDLEGAFLDVITGLTGTNNGVNELSANTGIQDFADSAVKSLAFVVDAADGVKRSFEVVGKGLGGLAAIATQPYTEAKGIWNAMKEDIDATLMAPTLGGALDARIATRKAKQAAEAAGTGAEPAATARPELKFNGKQAATKVGSGNDAIASAQLGYELDAIKRQAKALTDTYSGAERILEAQRSAALISESSYYQAKRALLDASSSAQEQALQAEIERLSREKLAGKEKLANEQKIATVTAELNKLRADTAVSIELGNIAEQAALRKTAQAYDDAAESANNYLDTIRQQNARDIDAIGKGSQYAERQSAKNAIEDKFTGRRQELDADKRRGQITSAEYDQYLAIAKSTYEEEVKLYDERTAAIDAKNADWVNGATTAFADYADEAKNAEQQTADAFGSALSGLEDALVSFVQTGKLDFKSLADSILADMARMAIKQNITGPLSGWLGGLLGGGSDSVTLSDGAIFASALTGARASGGPVSSGGTYLVGEKGPELLTMGGQGGFVTPNSALNQAQTQSGQTSIVVHVNSPTGNPAEIRRSAAAGARTALNAMNGARRYG